jgi:hypothetical protein
MHVLISYGILTCCITVQAVLTKPPLSTMWTSKGQNKLLNDYADAIANDLPNGDEIAAFELSEDILSYL